MKTKWFIIEDLDKFIESTRVIVFDGFGSDTKAVEDIANNLSQLSDSERAELEESLSQEECILMSKQFIRTQKHKLRDETRLLMSNKDFHKMIEVFNVRLVSNLLNCLVKRGLLDTAYDNESNDFIFWVKENENEKPKTD